MALRAVTLTPASRRLTHSRDGWRRQVETTLAQAALALRDGELQTLVALFDELETWGDEQRAYQARRQLVELAFTAADRLRVDQWIELYLTVAEKLAKSLDTNPNEPVMLNYLGIVMFEIGEAAAAEALFAAAKRLDPELEFVDSNRKAARARRGSAHQTLPMRLRSRAKALGARAAYLARRANAVKGQTMSLVMIVKNEEEMLPGCLEAVQDAVDEIVIVDTGSTDRTVEIAESFGAKVIDFPWNGSFSDARNCSIDNATCDWILYLDADEHLVHEDAKLLRRLTGRTWREAFYLVETNYTGGDDSGSSVAHLALRVFKRKPDYRFEGRIHEQKTQAMPTYLSERFETTEIRIRHYGYLKSRINMKEKSRRNIELLEVEARETPGPFVDFNLGSEYMALGDFSKARQYLDRGWDILRREEGWNGRGYAPMLATRVVQSRREDGDIDAAREAIDEALKLFPDNTELVLQASMCAKEDGDLTLAARLAERCLEMGDAPARYSATVGCGTYLARCLLAQVRTAQDRHTDAEQLYREALAESPEFVAPVLTLAASMLSRGVSPDEVRLAVPANGPSARLLLATALYESGHPEEAEADFRDVLARQPDHSVARIGLVETLLARRRYDAAAAEAAFEPDGSPLDAAAMGAELFARAAAGRLTDLEDALRRAPERRVSPADIALYKSWASAITGNGRRTVVPAAALETALTALEALLRVQEFDAFAKLAAAYDSIDLDVADRRHALAQIYFRRGYLDSAADEWIAAYGAAPEARTLIGLSQVAIARGLVEEAHAFAHEAVALAPANPQAARLVTALAERHPLSG
ncbi:MAG TPA: glycosyltransferase [Gaiellaceae bacterium]